MLVLGEEFTADSKLEEHIDLFPFGMKVNESDVDLMNRSVLNESIDEAVSLAQVLHNDIG